MVTWSYCLGQERFCERVQPRKAAHLSDSNQAKRNKDGPPSPDCLQGHAANILPSINHCFLVAQDYHLIL